MLKCEQIAEVFVFRVKSHNHSSNCEIIVKCFSITFCNVALPKKDNERLLLKNRRRNKINCKICFDAYLVKM